MINPQDLPENFFLSVAVGVQSFEDILKMHDIAPEEGPELAAHPLFQQRLLLAQELVEDSGQAFRARCRVIANDTLQHIRSLIRDTTTPPTVQLEAFKTLVKFGKLEPESPSAHSSSPTGPQLTLTIIAPNGETVFNAGAIASTPQLKKIEGSTLPAYPPEDDDWADLPDIPTERLSARDLGFAL